MKRVERIRCMMNGKLVMEGKRGETVEGETFFIPHKPNTLRSRRKRKGFFLP